MWVDPFASTGTALQVQGKAKFSRSGLFKVLSGSNQALYSMSGVTPSSLVFALLATNQSGSWIRAAVPTNGSFTVYFNQPLVADTWVCFFVLN